MEVYKTCLTCNGTGQIEHGLGTRTCYSCKGTGISNEGEIKNATQTLAEKLADMEDKLNDIMDKGNNIFDTYKIVEATSQVDYNALTAVNKDIYKMIISCGIVDLSDGTKIKAGLWSLFGEGTTTRTNLEALLEN